MKQPITKYIHHGDEVVVMEHDKGLHHEHCLCWNECKFFKPDSPLENCNIAEEVYMICIKHNLTLPVWECPYYVPIEQ